MAMELVFLKGLFGMLFHKYNTINMSSVAAVVLFLLTGAALLAAGYYFYHTQKIQWACGITGLPVLAIVLYFLVFLLLPYLMGERMN